MKRLTILSISIVIAIIVANTIIALLVMILHFSSKSNLPDIINIIIFILGFSIAIFFGLLSFKKIFKFLQSELKNL